jgi:hypothetical protein
LDTGSSGHLRITAQIDSARLYGSLSQMQREEAAKDSLTLTYGEMPPEQRQVLADFVFYGQKVIKDADGKERDGVNAPLLLASEILPDGIPLDAKLEVTDTTEPVFETEATIDNYSYVYPAGIEEVATKLAQLEQPDLFKGWPEVKGSAFQLSKMRTVNLTFRNGGITISDSIAENPPPTGPVIPINKLMENVPEDIQKKLRAQVDLVLKKMEKFVPQRGDPATPAPTGVSPP